MAAPLRVADARRLAQDDAASRAAAVTKGAPVTRLGKNLGNLWPQGRWLNSSLGAAG